MQVSEFYPDLTWWRNNNLARCVEQEVEKHHGRGQTTGTFRTRVELEDFVLDAFMVDPPAVSERQAILDTIGITWTTAWRICRDYGERYMQWRSLENPVGNWRDYT